MLPAIAATTLHALPSPRLAALPAIVAATRRNTSLAASPSPWSSGIFVGLLSSFRRTVLRPADVTDCVVVGVIDFRPTSVRRSPDFCSSSVRLPSVVRSTSVWLPPDVRPTSVQLSSDVRPTSLLTSSSCVRLTSLLTSRPTCVLLAAETSYALLSCQLDVLRPRPADLTSCLTPYCKPAFYTLWSCILWSCVL
jgi:hypothetical protein